MARLEGNEQLRDGRGKPLTSLRSINSLDQRDKDRCYGVLIPPRVFSLLKVSPETFRGYDDRRRISVIAPQGLGLLRVEARLEPEDRDPVFFSRPCRYPLRPD